MSLPRPDVRIQWRACYCLEMRIHVRKTPAQPMITFARDDGVVWEILPPDRTLPIPHDVVHLVVEEGMRLTGGFVGSIAAGAVFSSMRHRQGRLPPHGIARSRELIVANRRSLQEAEVFVAAFQACLGRTTPPSPICLRARAGHIPGGRPNPDEVERIWPILHDLTAQWAAAVPGDVLVLDWTRTTVRPRRDRRGRPWTPNSKPPRWVSANSELLR